MEENLVSLQNEYCFLEVDSYGGAIVNFQLLQSPSASGDELASGFINESPSASGDDQASGSVNPLNFRYHSAPEGLDPIDFKGHFLCLGRWGDPSTGELAAGLNKHGEFIKLKWTINKEDERHLTMTSESTLEGLLVKRSILLDTHSPCFLVKENVTNINSLGRLYQVVQHPTITAPFLNESTLVDCNASLGFDYASDEYDETDVSIWPNVKTASGEIINLVRPSTSYSSVFPFIIHHIDEHGWMTAVSPEHNLMLGYIWKRKDYPWINHWIHDGIYRGLEFGNTGVHKPFREILDKGLLKLLGESTAGFIDAGEIHDRSYLSFIIPVNKDYRGVERILYTPESITIVEKQRLEKISISHQFNLDDGF